MTYSVITRFSQAGYHSYGKQFLDSCEQFLPSEVDVHVYHEGTDLSQHSWLSSETNLLTDVKDCKLFLERHAEDPVMAGRQKLTFHRWKQKCIDEGYNFRFDAYKFCRKPFAVRHLIMTQLSSLYMKKHGKLFWIDADVVIYDHVPLNLFDHVLPDTADTSYLGRGTAYSECGFVGYNLVHTSAHVLINTVADMYAQDRVFFLPEWHDSYVYDHARRELGVHGYCIPSKGKSHVFINSELGLYMDHLKGDRKSAGRSEAPVDEKVRAKWRDSR